VEIRVFVWWFLYIRVCILKFYATKTEEGVKRKRRERRRGGFLEKIFFRRRLAFLAAGEKIFPLFWFTTFEKKGHSSTTNASPGGTGHTFLSPVKKKKCTQKHRSLSSSVKIVLTVRCLFGLGRTTTRTKTKRKTLKKKKRRRRRR